MVKLSWTKLEPQADPIHGIPCTRSSHGFSIVQNGTRLILHGGEHIARTPLAPADATWIADATPPSDDDDDDDENANPTTTWQWRRLDLKEVFPPARLAHAQAVYNDSIVYIFGGRAGIGMDELPMNDMWKLDASGPPGTETWTLIEPNEGGGGGGGDAPPAPRSFHRMVCVGTNLYVFGGCGVKGRLADLHRFDILTNTWHNLGTSALRGRGGANLLTLASGTLLGVVAGFAGEETSDGHLFDIGKEQWLDHLMEEDGQLEGLRPRSVCVSGSFPSVGVAIIFGGEIDPSQKGHEGAGDFANDVVVLDETSGKHLETVPGGNNNDEEDVWPVTRGWSDAASWDPNNSVGRLFIFGGLTGDDANPVRLDDLWRLDITAS